MRTLYIDNADASLRLWWRGWKRFELPADGCGLRVKQFSGRPEIVERTKLRDGTSALRQWVPVVKMASRCKSITREVAVVDR